MTRSESTFFSLEFRRNKRYKEITFFKSFTFNERGLEIDISLDETILDELVSFVSSFLASDMLDEDALWTSSVALPPVPSSGRDEKKLYFENLKLGPIKVNLGLRMREQHLSKDGISATIGALLKSGVASLDNVPIILNALDFRHPFTTLNELGEMIMRHYSTQVVQQFYKMIGYIDILGSPVSLLSSFSTGVYDFIHEPTQALFTNPSNLLQSVKKGTSSLVGRSAYGVLNSVSKISGSIGKVVATVSDDDRIYNHYRATRTDPRYFGDSLASGIVGLGSSLADGLLGVVAEPYAGFQSHGLLGLTTGLRRGLSGAVALPVLGLLDFVTTTTTGARNSALLLTGERVPLRQRPPAYLPDFSLPDYSLRAALGQYYLWCLQGYDRHVYQWHVEIEGGVLYLMSNTALFVVHIDATSAHLNILSTLFFEEIDIDYVETTFDSVIVPLVSKPRTPAGTHLSPLCFLNFFVHHFREANVCSWGPGAGKTIRGTTTLDHEE